MVAIRQTSLPAQHVNDEIQSLHLPASVQEAITSFPRPQASANRRGFVSINSAAILDQIDT